MTASIGGDRDATSRYRRRRHLLHLARHRGDYQLVRGSLRLWRNILSVAAAPACALCLRIFVVSGIFRANKCCGAASWRQRRIKQRRHNVLAA